MASAISTPNFFPSAPGSLAAFTTVRCLVATWPSPRHTPLGRHPLGSNPPGKTPLLEADTPPRGRHPSLSGHPLGRSPPGTWDTTGYGQQGGGTHPTGMHEFLFLMFVKSGDHFINMSFKHSLCMYMYSFQDFLLNLGWCLNL